MVSACAGSAWLLVNSDPWSPAEQKLEMLCDIHKSYGVIKIE